MPFLAIAPFQLVAIHNAENARRQSWRGRPLD
jgi:hypothetical protein